MRRLTRRAAILAGLAAGALAALWLSRRSRRASPDAPTVAVPAQDRMLLSGVGLFDGRKTQPGLHDLLIAHGRVARIAPAGTIESIDGRRAEGGAIVPGLIDAHVHLSFDRAENVVAAGVTAVLDLGEPIEYAFAPHSPLRFRAAGPLITAPGGYPTQSWGAGGYGLEVDGLEAARRAVAMLAERGAAMIKVAVQGEPSLDDETMSALADEAHARSLQVVAHALTRDSVARALDAGADALAHTPVDLLPDDLVATCGRRQIGVISTVRAFGGGDSARQNLAALAAAGCRIVYGTDLGNGGIAPGADAEELAILARALGSEDAAWTAATGDAASFAGFGEGAIAEGKPANLLVLDRLEFKAARRPKMIFIDGRAVS